MTKNTDVISNDGTVRGTLASEAKTMGTVKQPDGSTKRIKLAKLTKWHHGPVLQQVSERKRVRKQAKQARKRNR